MLNEMFPLLIPPKNLAITKIPKFLEIAHKPYDPAMPNYLINNKLIIVSS